MGATAVLLCLMAWSSAAGALPQVGGAGTGAAAAAAPLRLVPADSASSRRQPFTIEDDRLILDGKPIQIIAGSMHYFRMLPEYWADRLARAKAMGINTVEVYTPWNLHEPHPGQYVWHGMADVERWLDLIQDAGLHVLLRPGPYICAEWDNGGFPHWFASSEVAGGRELRMRTSDPAYLRHVDRWWAQVFSKLRRYLHENGGPILMVQMENEYGFCGEDKGYLRHLINTTRRHLSADIMLFTTDPPGIAPRGSIEGDEVYTVVDFGPGWYDPAQAFGAQAAMNPPGKSPPFCSEFYTGWLSHWGEPMANTSTQVLLDSTRTLLQWANSSTSISFYMIHGGTNFGFWAGANVDGSRYLPHITSYDYDSPISEAGDYCQPGIGGDCKYFALRDLIRDHTGADLPEPPPRPAIQKYGRVDMKQRLPLLDAVPQLFSGGGVRAHAPDIMEEYGQRWGLILYRTWLPASELDSDAPLDLGEPPHDYATVLLEGATVGRLDRSTLVTNLTLPAQKGGGSGGGGGRRGAFQLDILVEAMGRQNFGCDRGSWDFKGLQSPNVTLNGKLLRGWEVFPLQMDDVSSLSYLSGHVGAGLLGAARRRMLAAPAQAAAQPSLRADRDAAGGEAATPGVAQRNTDVPAFYRGMFDVDGATVLRGSSGHPADTYLQTRGWGKGLAWVNGFCLGWYWPTQGPQMTLYVPGPVLREGANELVLLEVERAPREDAVLLDDTPDFFGPGGASSGAASAARNDAGTVPPQRRRRVP